MRMGRLRSLFSFMVTFVGSVAMWWIYFDSSAHSGHHKITHSNDPGRLARLAYTYLHLPIAAGIIVTAVGDELVLGLLVTILLVVVGVSERLISKRRRAAV
ncbi:low temperature requirement protein A [Paenibacillus sp. FSL H8-0034]|uniref:low temperature requirement protein A n=1 Tax=Paenibacillus sp. FSL H8-0034 TaxID=2954671 RepID=UPI0030FAA7C7